MRKLFQIAGLVLMGVMLFSMSPASAMNTTPKYAKTPDPTICTAICGTPVTTNLTGNLTIHWAIDPCTTKGPHLVAHDDAPVSASSVAPSYGSTDTTVELATPAPKIHAKITCGGKSALADCASPLGHLPNVSEREVRSVDGRDRVKLIPICDRLDASLTQAQQNLAQHGNAETLVPAFAQNAVLTMALGHGRYRADDVVGIVMGTDTVMLYVHKM